MNTAIIGYFQKGIDQIGIRNFEKFVRLTTFLYILSFLFSSHSHKVSTFILPFFCLSFVFSYLTGNLQIFFASFNKWLVGFLVGLQVVMFGINIYFEYYSLNFNFYDTGFFSNPIANFSNGHGFFNSQIQLNELADHFCPNLLLFSPVYKYFPNGVVLVFGKLLAFVISILLLFRYARWKGVEADKIYFLVFLFATSVGVNNYMGFEFQASNLIVPLVFLLFHLWESKRYVLFYVTMIFACGFKENAPFILVSIGVFTIFVEGDFRKGFANIFLGTFLFFLISKVLMPYFSGSPGVNESMLDPFCCQPDKLYFIAYFLFSTGFVLFFYPRLLLVLLPVMAVSLLSNRPGAHTLTFHYQDIPTAVAFCLLIHVFVNSKELVPKSLWQDLDHRIFAAVFIGFSFFVNRTSANEFIAVHNPTPETRNAIIEIDHFKADCNKDSKIWAQTALAFYLSSEYQIRNIMNVDEVLADRTNNYIVLCDFAPGRWPIDADYERLKTALREDVARGTRAEHTGYYPLIIFELRYN